MFTERRRGELVELRLPPFASCTIVQTAAKIRQSEGGSWQLWVPSFLSRVLPSLSVVCIITSPSPPPSLPPSLSYLSFPSSLPWQASPRPTALLLDRSCLGKQVTAAVCARLLRAVSSSWSLPICWPSPAGGQDYELQALIKTGFVYPPACARRQQKQYDLSFAGPTARP